MNQLRNALAIEFIKASLASNHVQKETSNEELVDTMFNLAGQTLDRMSPPVDEREATPDELCQIIRDYIDGKR